MRRSGVIKYMLHKGGALSRVIARPSLHRRTFDIVKCVGEEGVLLKKLYGLNEDSRPDEH